MSQRPKVPSDLDTVFIECRGPLRHAWYAVNPPPAKRNTISATGEQHSFQCDRCGMLKHEVWGRRNGQLLTRYYVRPYGYAPLSREYNSAVLRSELIKRWNENPPALIEVDYSENGLE